MTEPPTPRRLVLMHDRPVRITINSATGEIRATGMVTAVTNDHHTGNVLGVTLGATHNPATTHSHALRTALLAVAQQRDETSSAVARAALDKALDTLAELQPADRPDLGLHDPIPAPPTSKDTS